ncbi:MAG: hypothetical protein AAFZ04_12370 [Pseudomonadota bacterium]
MGVTEDLADDLALKVIEYIDATGDEAVVTQLVGVLGATSQTAEEAFLTSLRVRRANIKARALLAEKIKAFKASQTKDT